MYYSAYEILDKMKIKKQYNTLNNLAKFKSSGMSISWMISVCFIDSLALQTKLIFHMKELSLNYS